MRQSSQMVATITLIEFRVTLFKIMLFKQFSRFKMPLLFFAIWSLDRWSKIAAGGSSQALNSGPLTFQSVFNYGLIFNTFSHLPAEIKLLLFSLMGVCIFGFYLLLLYIIDARAAYSKAGLTCIFAGIMANFSDRFAYPGVLDFISLNAWGHRSPSFNIADVFQWVGYVILVGGIIHESNYLRLVSTRRNQFFIFPNFQKKTCFVFLIISLCFNFLCSVTSYVFLKTTISLLDAPAANELIPAYFFSLIAMTMITTTMMVVFGLRFSHRIAGPVYSFQRFLTLILTPGDCPPQEFKLRDSDEFKELESIARNLKALRKKLTETADGNCNGV